MFSRINFKPANVEVSILKGVGSNYYDTIKLTIQMIQFKYSTQDLLFRKFKFQQHYAKQANGFN